MTTPNIVLRLFGQTQVGKGREKDEDSFVISSVKDTSPLHAGLSAVSRRVSGRGVLIAVSDGMGGARAGEVASSLGLRALRDAMSTAQAVSADVALRQSVEYANLQVFHAARGPKRGMGATLTAVLFHGMHAHIAEVGDSRAYLLRARRLVQLTRDQSYVQDLLDAGVLTDEQAKTSQYRNVILQAMGLRPEIQVAIRHLAIRNQDRFLVCSDGLCGVLDDQMMLNLILSSEDVQSACSKLVETAVEHGSEDDITVIMAEVGGEGAPLISDAERLSLETAQVFQPT